MGCCIGKSSKDRKYNQKYSPRTKEGRQSKSKNGTLATSGQLDEDQRYNKYEAALELFCDNHGYFFNHFVTLPNIHTASANFKIVQNVVTSQQFVAIKLMKPDTEQQKMDLYIYAYQLVGLAHPNVVKTISLYEESDAVYLTQEYCDGDNILQRVAKRHYTSEREMCSIISQLLSGLSYIHENGVGHYNMKPSDIIYGSQTNSQSNLVKLANFGLLSLHKWNRKVYDSREINFCAPEIFTQEKCLKSDIWSVGVFLYLLLSGTLPFDDKDNYKIEHNITKGIYSMRSNNWETVSEEAKNLIMQMLQFQPRRVIYQYRDKRPSAKLCLTHDWFNMVKMRTSPNNRLHASTIYNLKQRNNQNAILNACLIYLIDQGIEKEEQEYLIGLFHRIDKDNNGTISRQELTECFKTMMNENECKQRVDAIMQDGQSPIDYKKFLFVMANRRNLLRKTRIQQLFDQLDPSHHGYITKTEFKDLSRKINYKIDNLDYFFKEMDLDQNGKISFKEFQKALATLVERKK